MTLGRFLKDTRTTHEKDYERYKSEGGELGFHQWMLDLKKAGATRISLGERRDVSEMQADVALQKSIRSGAYRTKVIKETIGSPTSTKDAFVTKAKYKTDKNFTGIEKQKIAMRRRVLNDITAANPGSKITKKEIGDGNIGTGVIFYVDDVEHTTWNDPSISELKF